MPTSTPAPWRLPPFPGGLRLVVEEARSMFSGRLHCHYSCIEYTKAGEKRHLPLSAKDPIFSLLAPALQALSGECTIICETPLPVADAVAMRDEYGWACSQARHPHEQQ